MVSESELTEHNFEAGTGTGCDRLSGWNCDPVTSAEGKYGKGRQHVEQNCMSWNAGQPGNILGSTALLKE